jgi:hypothetical protein
VQLLTTDATLMGAQVGTQSLKLPMDPASATQACSGSAGPDGSVSTTLQYGQAVVASQEPKAQLSPGSLSFSSFTGLSSAPQTLTLTNAGGGTLQVPVLSFAAGAGSAYQASNNCGAGLGAGQTCQIDVTFSPTTAGSFPDTLQVQTNQAVQPVVPVSLSASATNALQATPASLAAFGNEQAGQTSAAQTITLSNAAPASLPITLNSSSTDFPVSNACGSSVPATGSCTVAVSFAPAVGESGSKTGTLTVSSASGSYSFSESGTATSLGASPSQLASFGTVIAGGGTNSMPNSGGATAQTITLSNSASTAASVGISSSDASDFPITNNTCAGSVPANGSCSFVVNFSPASTSTGTLSSTISVSSPAGSYTWSASGSVAATSMNVAYLVVGGGGGGGEGGGGGAGGVIPGNAAVAQGVTYTIAVGAGGPSSVSSGQPLNINGNGGNSQFGSVVAYGGGAGATVYTANGGGASSANGTTFKGANGGSGGGSGGNYTNAGQIVPGGSGVGGQGHAGGANDGESCSPSGGGGGAGTAGGNSGGGVSGTGGAGISSSITGTSVVYGGGGGGGSYCAAAAPGGSGGGGSGSNSAGAPGVNGIGGGGGGGPIAGGAGGSGVVIISVPSTDTTVHATGGYSTSKVGSNTVYTFTSAGTITF